MYKPSQRRVHIDVLATAGWISGTFHVPVKNSLVATLNKKGEFLSLTQVATGEDAPVLDFLALRREAIMLVIPEADDIERHASLPPGHYEHARVRCILADATVEGTIQMLASLRISDFLETNPGFFLLSDASLSLHDGQRHERVPHLIVNTTHVLAVSDPIGRPVPELVGAEV